MTTALRTFQTTIEAPLSFVSATSYGVEAEQRGMERPHVPNYALRRALVGTAAAVVAVVAMVALVGLVAGVGGSPAVASDTASPAASSATVASTSVHVAQPGDTMWSIANTYRGDVDRDRYIDVLVRLNGGTGVRAGEAVWLP